MGAIRCSESGLGPVVCEELHQELESKHRELDHKWKPAMSEFSPADRCEDGAFKTLYVLASTAYRVTEGNGGLAGITPSMLGFFPRDMYNFSDHSARSLCDPKDGSSVVLAVAPLVSTASKAAADVADHVSDFLRGQMVTVPIETMK